MRSAAGTFGSPGIVIIAPGIATTNPAPALTYTSLTLALKAYDILGQSKNLSVSDSSNIHKETRNNTLGRYVILSLTYRFGNFNQGGGRRGPGGPMGGGPRGPMGGGPRR